jgi:hypothetical protein
MLTKSDLSQIQKVVHSEIQSETPGIIRKIVQNELKPIKKDIRSIKKDINLIVRTFDREYVSLRRKVEEHIEHHPYPIVSP